jgi:hypothetical protein
MSGAVAGTLLKVIGEQVWAIIPEIVEALSAGHEWEPLIDKLGHQTKVALAQSLAKEETIKEVEEIRRRYLP